jgi:hypothetical protein
MRDIHRSSSSDWPELPFDAWADTAATLHLWTQIVGKVRLVQTPWQNHSWHVPLYLSARGLTTGPIPYGARAFEMIFDFIDQRLLIDSTDGKRSSVLLKPRSVADFYAATMRALAELGIEARIHKTPSEIADAVPFDEDTTHQSYDSAYAARFWQALVQIDRVFKEFRSGFVGKVSPVHFFWGSFDIAVTRFSGREAPPHPGGVPNFPDWVAREAYSHEVSSAGFWPGAGIDHPAFYSYAYPSPEGYSERHVGPDEAYWSNELGEFILPYEVVRSADSPDEVLLEFLQSTYEAAADLAGWDRKALEKDFTRPAGG